MRKKMPTRNLLTKADAGKPPTFGQYLTMVQAASSPGPGQLTDAQKYVWAQYQRLFDINHQAIEQARAEALARRLAAQGHP